MYFVWLRFCDVVTLNLSLLVVSKPSVLLHYVGVCCVL